MAHIVDAELDFRLDPTRSRQGLFGLSFGVVFSDADRRLNMTYAVSAGIYEIDDLGDELCAPLANGRAVDLQRCRCRRDAWATNSDAFVGWLEEGGHPDPTRCKPTVMTVSANGREGAELTMSLSAPLDDRRQRRHDAYRAFVNLVPDIAPAFAWSKSRVAPVAADRETL